MVNGSLPMVDVTLAQTAASMDATKIKKKLKKKKKKKSKKMKPAGSVQSDKNVVVKKPNEKPHNKTQKKMKPADSLQSAKHVKPNKKPKKKKKPNKKPNKKPKNKSLKTQKKKPATSKENAKSYRTPKANLAKGQPEPQPEMQKTKKKMEPDMQNTQPTPMQESIFYRVTCTHQRGKAIAQVHDLAVKKVLVQVQDVPDNRDVVIRKANLLLRAAETSTLEFEDLKRELNILKNMEDFKDLGVHP